MPRQAFKTLMHDPVQHRFNISLFKNSSKNEFQPITTMRTYSGKPAMEHLKNRQVASSHPAVRLRQQPRLEHGVPRFHRSLEVNSAKQPVLRHPQRHLLAHRCQQSQPTRCKQQRTLPCGGRTSLERCDAESKDFDEKDQTRESTLATLMELGSTAVEVGPIHWRL